MLKSIGLDYLLMLILGVFNLDGGLIAIAVVIPELFNLAFIFIGLLFMGDPSLLEKNPLI
jgi:hypothetical protein